MNILGKIIFLVVFLIIIYLVYKKFFNKKILEPFTEDDLNKKNIIILTYYFSDSCPASREFLYGCCRALEESEEIIESKEYMIKNKDINGGEDSYGNKIRYWFMKGSNSTNSIIKSIETKL